MCPDHRTVVSIFDRIAPVYDSLNRVISWGLDQKWRRDLARHMDLNPRQRILDVSAGTGDMEPALKAVCSRIDVIGIDPSRPMADLYRTKVPTATLTQGIAEFLPIKAETMDRAVCTFGLRNFQNRSAAYREIYRILKPGGLWGFLEMSAPVGTIFPQVYGFYFKRIVPLIGQAFSPKRDAYEYLRDSVYGFPNIESLEVEHHTAHFLLSYCKLILRGAVILAIFKKQ